MENFVKICLLNFDKFFQISVPLTGTPKNNCWDTFWANLGFRAFLNAARGKGLATLRSQFRMLVGCSIAPFPLCFVSHTNCLARKSEADGVTSPSKRLSPPNSSGHRSAVVLCYLSAPKSQRFLRFAIAMPIADPRNRGDLQDKRKQCCVAI